MSVSENHITQLSKILSDQAIALAKYSKVLETKRRYVKSDKGKAARARASAKYYYKLKKEKAENALKQAMVIAPDCEIGLS